jgi:hypothetical protein
MTAFFLPVPLATLFPGFACCKRSFFVAWLLLPQVASSPTTQADVRRHITSAHATSVGDDSVDEHPDIIASAASMITNLLPFAALRQHKFVPAVATHQPSIKVCQAAGHEACHRSAGTSLGICRSLPAGSAATWSAVTAGISCLTLASGTMADKAIIRQSRLPWQKGT